MLFEQHTVQDIDLMTNNTSLPLEDAQVKRAQFEFCF